MSLICYNPFGKGSLGKKKNRWITARAEEKPMAAKRWRGGAGAVAQVTNYTLGGTWEADDLVLIQIGGRVLPVTAGATTATAVAANVVTAMNGASRSLYPEFVDVTASSTGAVLTLTGTAGVPF